MKTKEKSRHSIDFMDQGKLGTLSSLIVQNMDMILLTLGVTMGGTPTMRIGCCPVHGGDRFNAFNIYESGYWACRSRHCELHFKKTPLGMMRGILSHQKYGWSNIGDTEVTFGQTIRGVLDILGISWDEMEVDRDAVEKMQFVKQMQIVKKKEEEAVAKKVITRDKIRRAIDIPAQYYLDRGYTPQILDKYDVGFCRDKTKEMRYRVVVPVYNEDGNYVGCCGRSIFPQCDKCHVYHHVNSDCPKKEFYPLYCKWKHSGFKSHEHLYNYSNAKPFIQQTGAVILVESPGNVWRLEEAGIHNSVAIFGSCLSETQKTILDSSGALSIIVLGDNDDAGKGLFDTVKEKCQRTYRLYCVSLDKKNDVGDMSVDEVTEEIRPLIEQLGGLSGGI